VRSRRSAHSQDAKSTHQKLLQGAYRIAQSSRAMMAKERVNPSKNAPAAVLRWIALGNGFP
jgi:hypothetical protein